MKVEIKVPSLGESISEATIGQILAPSGTIVKTDAEILELETDKVNQVLYALQAGQVNLSVNSGDAVKIGQTIGFIETSQRQESAEGSKLEQPASTPPQTPPAESISQKPQKDEYQKKGEKHPQIRYQQEAFLADLNSPPVKESLSSKNHEPALQPKQISTKRETRRPMSKIRKVIAHRLVEAQHTMAALTTFNEVDMTQIMLMREKYKESFTKKYGCKLGLMSFFVKAAVFALQAFPDFNSYLDGEEIVHREYFDIGVAVGTEKGVIVPVIRNCNQLNFAEIEQTIENYAKKAKEGTLVADDLQGGGFTITNGGTYGSLLSTPILLPPQCGILGMHKIEKRPIVVNDQVAIRSMMYLALSYDHRLVDGKEAVSFLVVIKNMLEEPSRLLLDI